MAFSTSIKHFINKNVLKNFNLYIETLTIENLENKRLEILDKDNYFSKEAFPIPNSFKSVDISEIVESIEISKIALTKLTLSSLNDVGYTFINDFYSSPDAEILYVMIGNHKPRIFLEIGSGHSTKIARQSIIDHQLDTKIWSIDPQPRAQIDALSDKILRCPVESLNIENFAILNSGDILFIDSSHKILPGNDVVFLFLNVLPSLKKGVIIHIHDIFLPFEYPKELVKNDKREWNEQYLVQVILEFSQSFEVLWPGHFLQKNNPDFNSYFENIDKGIAQSLWLRKK